MNTQKEGKFKIVIFFKEKTLQETKAIYFTVFYLIRNSRDSERQPCKGNRKSQLCFNQYSSILIYSQEDWSVAFKPCLRCCCKTFQISLSKQLNRGNSAIWKRKYSVSKTQSLRLLPRSSTEHPLWPPLPYPFHTSCGSHTPTLPVFSPHPIAVSQPPTQAESLLLTHTQAKTARERGLQLVDLPHCLSSPSPSGSFLDL